MLHPTDPIAAQRWLNRHETLLFQGHADQEDGYPIGSGMAESEAKQFKARFCGPGMRWSRQGAERLIPIRAAIMGHQFDTLWPLVYNSPPN